MRARALPLFWLLAFCFVWIPGAAAAHEALHADPLQLDDGVYCVVAHAGERDKLVPVPEIWAAAVSGRLIPSASVPVVIAPIGAEAARLAPIRGPPLA